MDFIEDCMESILACFHKNKDEDTTKKTPRQPMYYLDPLELLDEGKLEKDFENFVEECGLSEERRADLRTYSKEKKLIMLNNQTFRQEEDCDKLISVLRAYEKDSTEHIAPSVSTLQDIVITLRTQCSRYFQDHMAISSILSALAFVYRIAAQRIVPPVDLGACTASSTL
ncbi:hypothetical protein ANCCAN_01890 [Ancylostoma caninum]|uniref:Uncharacterized protein n=1 Tax=Ancylostoma caninum TaxID=29170 RepID=A0A368H672_ANCCA|nr:hypothetical protein ANCCAN_01890 [Ancylostoma caninum]